MDNRIILHSDMNCFYASVEMKVNPSLRKIPLAVVGSQAARGGIILARNDIAKKAGVKTAEVIWEAKEKCPTLVTVPPNYELYEYYSRKAFDLYRQYAENVEPYGIDEAWIDLSGDISIRSLDEGKSIADEIRYRVKDELGLTCSVGVSWNKALAKLGSDYKKPDATTLFTPDNFRELVWPLPVEDLLFVGPSTKRKLHRINIMTIGDLAALPLAYVQSYLGQNGIMLWIYANGLDESPVRSGSGHEYIKTIGNSATTRRDMESDADVWKVFLGLADHVAARLRRHSMMATTVQISLRRNDLSSFERQAKLSFPTNNLMDLANAAYRLHQSQYDWNLPLRSIGLRACVLIPSAYPRQISFYDRDYRTDKTLALDKTIDSLRLRFGSNIITRGSLMRNGLFSYDIM